MFATVVALALAAPQVPSQLIPKSVEVKVQDGRLVVTGESALSGKFEISGTSAIIIEDKGIFFVSGTDDSPVSLYFPQRGEKKPDVRVLTGQSVNIDLREGRLTLMRSK